MGKRRQQVRLWWDLPSPWRPAVAAACGGGGNESSSSGGQQATPPEGGVLRHGITDFGFTNGFDPTGEYVAVAIGLYAGRSTRTLMGYQAHRRSAGQQARPRPGTAPPEISSDGG